MSEPCRHETVAFGSGGHYVFCRQCGAIWCSHPTGDSAMTMETYKKAQSNVCQTGTTQGTRVTPGLPKADEQALRWLLKRISVRAQFPVFLLQSSECQAAIAALTKLLGGPT